MSFQCIGGISTASVESEEWWREMNFGVTQTTILFGVLFDCQIEMVHASFISYCYNIQTFEKPQVHVAPTRYSVNVITPCRTLDVDFRQSMIEW
jgi:hypothetical protein